tara:strand:+ start:761 stop:988 length:228 start_codon:yes stop_codon:yes gene_type:complete
MNNKTKWDMHRHPDLNDYILSLFGDGLDRDQTYWAVASHLLLKNKAQRQAIADLIAQLHSMNVSAAGRIPEKEVA